jgi:hypothetical protein
VRYGANEHRVDNVGAMRRRLLAFLAAASLTLCMTLLVCWWYGRSGYRTHYWDFNHKAGRCNSLTLESGPDATALYLSRPLSFAGWGEQYTPFYINGSGIEWTRYSDYYVCKLCIYHRSGVCVCGIMAIIFTYGRLRRSRQPAEGVCRQCGYDLRATPDRCPECGAAPAAKVTT